MARGYSRDLRERLLQAEASGVPAVEIQRTMGVSPRSIRRWKRTHADGASLEPRCSPGRHRRITAEQEPELRAQVLAHPDATLAEHGVQWASTGHAAVSEATMSRALTRLGLPLKKRR